MGVSWDVTTKNMKANYKLCNLLSYVHHTNGTNSNFPWDGAVWETLTRLLISPKRHLNPDR